MSLGTTKASWGALPWLLTRKQVIAATGLQPRDLRKLVANGILHRHKTTRKGRYFKAELARVCGIQCD